MTKTGRAGVKPADSLQIPERNGFDNDLSVLSYPPLIFTTMSLLGMHPLNLMFSTKSSAQVKRPVTALGVVGRVLAAASLWAAVPARSLAQDYTFTTFAGEPAPRYTSKLVPEVHCRSAMVRRAVSSRKRWNSISK